MGTLSSGLDESIADSEDLARFLTSSGHYNAAMPKPAAFLPNPKDRETSVFRHGDGPTEELWHIGEKYAASERTLHGAAVLKAGDVRRVKLDILAGEPPPRHAAIVGWPLVENDPELQRAQQKGLALLLASVARLVLR